MKNYKFWVEIDQLKPCIHNWTKHPPVYKQSPNCSLRAMSYWYLLVVFLLNVKELVCYIDTHLWNVCIVTQGLVWEKFFSVEQFTDSLQMVHGSFCLIIYVAFSEKKDPVCQIISFKLLGF